MMRWLLIVVVVLGLGGAAYVWLAPSDEAPSPSSSTEGKSGLMTEDERLEYVKNFVRAVDLEIGPDTKPDSTEPVPGLLRVKGKVINEGDRALDKVVVAIYPKNEDGEVMAVDQQDVIGRPDLEPEEIREFEFQVRDRPGFSGTFDHALK